MKKVKRVLSVALAVTMAMSTLAACGKSEESATKPPSSGGGSSTGEKTSEGKTTESKTSEGTTSEGTTTESAKEIDKSKLPVLSLYPKDANLISGLVTGHKADYFAEHGFQLEVWAYSDEKTNSILVSGDLPDLIYLRQDERFDTLVQNGQLLKLDDYIDKMPHLYTSPYMEGAVKNLKENRSAGTGDMYALPLYVGEGLSRWSDSTDRKPVKLKWDVYEKIGAPEIKDYWQLIDVMEQMLKAEPTSADGTKNYGTFLNSGSDSRFFGGLELWCYWHGYDVGLSDYMGELDMVNQKFDYILEENSLFHEGLKWYNEVYRRGLLDPDSIGTDRPTQAKKIDAGYAMVPSGTLPGWAPKYYEYYIPGTKVYYDNCSELGDATVVLAVNADTKYLDECLKVLDMWCDPDAMLRIIYGPDGDLWFKDGENVYHTEKYIDWLKAGNSSANLFPMSDGTEFSQWNTPFGISFGTLTSLKDGKGNQRPAGITSWEEQQIIVTTNETFGKWQKTTGYKNWQELLKDKKALYSSSDITDYVPYFSLPSDEMAMVMSSIKDIVVTAAWNMVYAESEEEFTKIWDKMVEDSEKLGAKDVYEWKLDDIEAAKQKFKSK